LPPTRIVAEGAGATAGGVIFGLPKNIFNAWLIRDIAGMVAAMTEGDPGVGVKKLIDNSIPG
jgi:hypothetical protein